jgi:3-oxoacyl-[acyl-carrier protein] reductase
MNVLISGGNSGLAKRLIFYLEKNRFSVYKLIRKKKLDYNEINCDYNNIKEVHDAVKKISKLNIDLYINCISDIGNIYSLENLNISSFKKTFNVNFFSELLITSQVIKNFLKKKRGGCLIFFSGGGASSYPSGIRKYLVEYNCAKTSLTKLSEIIANQYVDKNINSNVIAPGLLPTKSVRNILKRGFSFMTREEKFLLSNSLKKKKIFDQDYLKIYKLILFLFENRSITGKIFSSKYDSLKTLKKNKKKIIKKNDLYTIRRIVD